MRFGTPASVGQAASSDPHRGPFSSCTMHVHLALSSLTLSVGLVGVSSHTSLVVSGRKAASSACVSLKSTNVKSMLYVGLATRRK